MIVQGVTKHARERMAERFGRDLPEPAWLQLVAAIREGRALLVRRTGKTEEWRVEVIGLVIEAAWSPEHATVVSVKDPDQMGAHARTDAAKHAPIRKSLRRFGGYRNGKLYREGTEWQR